MHQEQDGTMDSMQTVSRLIKKFAPSDYNLSLNINRSNRSFYGTVEISGESKPNTNDIILHSKDLDIKSITVDNEVAKYSFNTNDELSIYGYAAGSNKHKVIITFSGKISDAMHGLYPCYYNHNGVRKEILATQFESHHAREVFPCIDEPESKAVYSLTLISEPNVAVLGNMPVKTQNNKNNKMITTFEATPPMSSYLLAWVIGDMHKITGKTKSGVDVNIWATPAQTDASLGFALDIATRTIDFFDEYFDTPYPLPKCDHVALPDFSSGAMENWGLITYRESALLVEPDVTSIASRHYVATVIAHELSHQWFGNLVTMKWWNDLWLNESFASLVEYTAVEALEPSWNIWLDFACSETIYSLRRDSLEGVQPVQSDVSHPDEISTLFDGAIVYAKGSRLLQMLQHYIGNDAFQAGLKSYFKKYAYKNTEAKDLWNEFSAASDKDIATFMTKWIKQPGFPVLHAAIDGDSIKLDQEKLVSRLGKKTQMLWPVVLNTNHPEAPKLLDKKSIKIANNNLPIRFNIGGYAHYITHYDPQLMSGLISQITKGEMPIIDRLQLLHEQTMLANAGIIDSAELIPLICAYKNETCEPVWDMISLAIGNLKKFVEDDPAAENKLKQLAADLAKFQYARLGWKHIDNEPEADTKLRVIIISLMVYAQDPMVIKLATDEFVSTPIEQIDPDLRDIIISTMVKHKFSKKIVTDLFDQYKSTSSVELQQDICLGLTATKNIATINMLLEAMKDKNSVRSQNAFLWFIYLIRNRYSRDIAWLWLRNNWTWIEETFKGDKSYDDYPRYAATALCNDQQLKEYIDFFTPYKSEPALKRVIEIGINEIRDRADIISHDKQSVIKALLNL